mgnify:CR=1 FL=1
MTEILNYYIAISGLDLDIFFENDNNGQIS